LIVGQGLVSGKVLIHLTHKGLDVLYILFRLVPAEYFG